VISFSEQVTGLTLNDFSVTNARITNLAGSGAEYTATLTAIAEGDITVSLPDERVVDGVGNRNVESNIVTLVHRVVDSIVLEGADETIDMTTHDETVLATVKTIDIRGTGRNTLVLDAAKITALTPNRTLVVIANQGDSIEFDDGWTFETVEAVNGQLQRIFTNSTAIVRVIGPLSWTNPLIKGDVNGSGDVTAGDALDIIFSFGLPQLSDSQGRLVDATTVAPSAFRFYDPNEDGMSTAADALFVINILFLQSLGASGEGEVEGELNVVPSALVERRDVERREVEQVDARDVLLDRKPKPSSADKSQRVVLGLAATEPSTANPSEAPDEKRQDQDVRLGDLDATLTTVWDWI
jgi:Bacterial Ig-like domain/Dockerin type I domain